MASSWKSCSVCRTPIPFSSSYYRCSVTSCKSGRKAAQFCTVQCWDEHRADMGHRNAWAEEEQSPREGVSNSHRTPKRTIISEVGSKTGEKSSQYKPLIGKPVQTETLVVVSKVKGLIRDLAEMNTSQCAIDALTQLIVTESRKAIASARANGRKTVMGRDFEPTDE